jgi:hypothetical protein
MTKQTTIIAAERAARKTSQPPILWRCPACNFEALSKYAARQHRHAGKWEGPI